MLSTCKWQIARKPCWIFITTALLATILLKLWLVQGFSLCARNYFFDDLLYVDQAQSLINGQWLGRFNFLTLAKGPGYPIWIAISCLSGLPLLFSQHLLYLFACSLLILAMRPIVKNPYFLLILFVILAFDPQSFNTRSLRVVREGVYASQIIAVIACLIGTVTRIKNNRFYLFGWSASLGGFMAFFLITREEGFLLLPSIGLLLLFGCWLLWRQKVEHRWQRIGIIFSGPAIAGLLLAGVQQVNLRNYGLPIIVEQSSKPYKSMIDALQRVRHHQWNRYIPLPKETRMKIYGVSSAFAELQPFMEGRIGQMWTRMSVARLPKLVGNADIGGAWYIWALRDSIVEAGHYRSANDVMTYYMRIAAEVNEACDTGKLNCYSGPIDSISSRFMPLLPHLF